MNDPFLDPQLRRFALMTGLALLLMAFSTGFAYGYVQGTLYLADDAAATVKHLEHNLGLYKLGVIAWFITAFLDLVVCVGLYRVYRADKSLAATTAILRCIYTVIFIIAIIQLVYPLFNHEEIANGQDHFVAFVSIWSFGLIIFGIHLLLLSLTGFRSGFTPRFISVLLFIAGLSYIFVDTSKTFFSDYALVTPGIEATLSLPMALGELCFAFWLVYRWVRAR